MLVEDAGRGNERREIWDQADHLRAQLVDGHRSPTLIIVPPHPDALTRLLGRDEAGEDRLFRMGGGDRQDVRQDALKPRHLPFGAFGKHPLHIDAEMNRGLSGRAVAQCIALGHGLIPENQL